MKKLSRNTLILFMCLISVGSLVAQISTGEKPISFNFELKYDSKLVKTMPSIDIKKLQKEDAINDSINDFYRFGYSHKVDYNLENSGQWFDLPNGDRIWQLHIYCPNALSINFTYSKFWLPKDAKFFVYSSDKKQTIGAFTYRNNKGDKENISGFATALLYTDSIILEYYLPKDVEEKGIISIDDVVYGYRCLIPNTVNKAKETLQGIPPCRIDINCSEGNAWQSEKRAVAIMTVGGAAYGTGSLINNTNNDFSPLFLSAKHVVEGDIEYHGPLSYCVFYWNYENTGCNTPNVNWDPNYATTGAIKLSANTATDFALLQLAEDPAELSGYTPYYLGWDRTGSMIAGGVCIHHPASFQKKISTYNVTPVTATQSICPLGYGANYWMVSWIDAGSGYSETATGSSGAALINNQHHIIGQLHGACQGANRNCWASPSPSTYGKFNISWNDGTTSQRRLKDWLDPLNTGETILDGISYCSYTYISETVTGWKKVICKQIEVQNTTINSGATLILDGGVQINQGFTVQQGATFIIQ